jgi:hypothetical protein
MSKAFNRRRHREGRRREGAEEDGTADRRRGAGSRDGLTARGGLGMVARQIQGLSSSSLRRLPCAQRHCCSSLPLRLRLRPEHTHKQRSPDQPGQNLVLPRRPNLGTLSRSGEAEAGGPTPLRRGVAGQHGARQDHPVHGGCSSIIRGRRQTRAGSSGCV